MTPEWGAETLCITLEMSNQGDFSRNLSFEKVINDNKNKKFYILIAVNTLNLSLLIFFNVLRRIDYDKRGNNMELFTRPYFHPVSKVLTLNSKLFRRG